MPPIHDLLQATGYAAIAYLLFNYLVSFGSGRPLVEWINPGRKYLPILAVTLFGGAYTSLHFAANKYQLPHLTLLSKLVSEEKAPPEVLGSLSFLTLGLAVLMLAIWCWWFLPRSPQTFSPNPRDLMTEYRRALRHYVRWTGGLDFAILCEVRSGKLEVIAEGSDNKELLRGLNRLPGVHSALEGQRQTPDIEAQKRIWRELASDLFNKWGQLNDLVAPARQGGNVALSFDVRYGAIYVEMLEEASTESPSVGLFLFATALNQHEVNTLTAARHFWMLTQAIRHIRTGVAKG